MLDVVVELRLERVDAVELALAAQEVAEADLGLLAVEVAVEVEQVGLEQRVVGVLVERRAAAEVDRARCTRPSGRSYHPAYTPSAGMHTEFGTSTLAVGKPSRRPRWSPITTLPRTSCGRPSMLGRHLDVATGEGPPDRRAADRLLDAVVARDEIDGLDDEVVIDAVRLEQAHVAVAVAAEVEVLADDDDLHGERAR